jgi:hypothetical protein
MKSEREWIDALQGAIKFFWEKREDQGARQGIGTGSRDAGSRTDVTGGAHMRGFAELVQSLLVDAGLPHAQVSIEGPTLPGYFRPSKQWDLIAVSGGHLVATIEFKSHVGPSFGNNFNNRVEEALGSATDVLTAYKHGVYEPSQRPWLGYLMLLEDCEATRQPPRSRLRADYFDVRSGLQEASYSKRYESLCVELVRERLYDAACLLVSNREAGRGGGYVEPCEEVGFASFARKLYAHASSFGAFPAG